MSAAAAADALATVLAAQRRRLVARLARSTGLDAAGLIEDAVQAASLQALDHWARDGVPDNPAGWLWRTAWRQAIDRWRADRRLDPLEPDAGPGDDTPADGADTVAPGAVAPVDPAFAGELADDELAVLFAACHPALPAQTQVALALRTLQVLDLRTIADGLLTNETALAQRLARARTRLRGEPVTIPAGAELPPRREAVLTALAVMFQAGWQAGAHDPRALAWEAIRLARTLAAHPVAGHPDADALAAMLALHGARLSGRLDADGDIVPLPGQDRDRWDPVLLRLGFVHLDRARAAARLSRWHLLAGIAAAHAGAASYAETDWPTIVRLYDRLVALDPSAPPRLSHAIARVEAGDAAGGHAALLALAGHTPATLEPHRLAALAHAAQRLGRPADARAWLAAAVEAAPDGADRRWLARRLQALPEPPG